MRSVNKQQFEMLPTTRSSVALPDEWPLHHGGTITDGQLAYCLYGDVKLPCILVLGGISAGRDVAHQTEQYASGWWQQHINYHGNIDLNKFCVLAVDYIGGNGDSSAPNRSFDPTDDAVSTKDQAFAIAFLLEQLEIGKLLAAVGSSYGGNVVLSLCQHFPDRVANALVISAADRSTPSATALRFIQRQIIKQSSANTQPQAVALARSLAMLSYRTSAELDRRFDGRTELSNRGLQAPIIDYLNACGESFAATFSADSFLRLSQSIDLHSVPPERIKPPLSLVAVDSDLLFPVSLIEELSERTNANLTTIQSNFGHDAFLKEDAKIGNLLRNFLTSCGCPSDSAR
ncbi:MAG: alpha/beta fold hydrolase [Kangiellaceae bacterium]|jgi:homoserine O-acetyltransferase|nr:alpha/beta fold hydrolase [Kangiellaceae bacterium]